MEAERSDQDGEEITISSQRYRVADQNESHYSSSTYKSEIEEVGDSSNTNLAGLSLDPINEDILEGTQSNPDDCVYVGIGKSESSMGALTWAIQNAVDPSATTVYLIHVFPEIRHVPSPLGNLPASQVNRDQLETFMAQESNKRRQLIQKFLHPCHASQVKVETVLIESDMVAKAIIDLIPVLNIRKLVVGTSKSNLRRLKTKKGSGIIADQILHSMAVEASICDLKIICEGNEVILDHLIDEPSSPAPSPSPSNPAPEETKDIVSCMCFRMKSG